MRKLTLVLALVVAGVVGAQVAPAGATCTTGEICFYKNDNGGGAVYETISRAQSHTNLKFTDRTAVRNNVDSVRNRDTSCNIKVVDDRGLCRTISRPFRTTGSCATSSGRCRTRTTGMKRVAAETSAARPEYPWAGKPRPGTLPASGPPSRRWIGHRHLRRRDRRIRVVLASQRPR
jgi:hypothetical protein